MIKTALITGAADRIGADIAKQLANIGYAVIIHYNNSETKAQNLAETLQNTGAQAACIQADLIDRKSRAELFHRAGLLFGPISVLINNASAFEPDSLETLKEDFWDMHMRVHAEAPVFLARDFYKQLPHTEHGNIINIIDERVLHLTPDYFSYTLSKATLHAATRTLAQSLAPRVRVNAIAPGPTLKNIRQTDEQFLQSQSALPLQKGPSPSDISQAVLNIISMKSMTGQTLAIDGGEHLDWPIRSKVTPRIND